MSDADFPRLELESKIKAVFTPHAPINRMQFFAGRRQLIRDAADAVTTPGLHPILYGERGVGKTSLANILKEILEDVVGLSRINCTGADTFESAIRRSLAGITLSNLRERAGFRSDAERITQRLSTLAGNEPTPDVVAELLSQLPPYVMLVIDEFDRLPQIAKAAFADFLKALSDRGASATIVMVGVADDVTELLADHASVERCLRQIRVRRMPDSEIVEILDKGFPAAGFSIEDASVRDRIVSVAQGFPHYAHLLAQNAARAALDDRRTVVSPADVTRGIVTAVGFADQSHRELYHRAVTGTKKRNLWKEVVAACALAECDERGFFPSRAVQESLSAILQRDVIQQTVAFHLGSLTETSRGPLLQRIGPERRYRYRFLNPLMKPFVLMKAMADGLLVTPPSTAH